MNIKRIKDPVYETTIWCVWDCDNDELVEWVKKKYKQEINNICYAGRAIELNDGHYSEFIIYFYKAEWVFDFISVLHHELWHLTQYIMEYVGIEFNEHTTESYAYFSSYLLREILSTIFKQDIYE